MLGGANVQQAIYNTLMANASALPDIYAPAPQDTTLPYVEIGDSSAFNADAQCLFGVEEVVGIHVWSDPGSMFGCKQVMDTISNILHYQQIPVTGRGVPTFLVDSSRCFLDEDGQAMHGIVEIRVIHFDE